MDVENLLRRQAVMANLKPEISAMLASGAPSIDIANRFGSIVGRQSVYNMIADLRAQQQLAASRQEFTPLEVAMGHYLGGAERIVVGYGHVYDRESFRLRAQAAGKLTVKAQNT